MPGFFTKNGSWDMASCRDPGILIPVCTKDDRIQGLQIRLDDPPPKIVYDSLGFQKSVEKLRRLQRKYNARIIFPHDLAQFETLEKCPIFYK